MPPNTVYVGRPSLFGNPYTVKEWGESGALEAFRVFVAHHPHGRAMATFVRQFLHGKNLACWCPLDKPCHADVLLEIANQ